ncbi:hypothetical protein A8F94_12755 [Bacillus sp. FJAT-27225]|uniref:hypothetical protein n=1 Tax=Bacillus sp. FJAT-27225 TaxID=1743144 RepID=UPI00080C25DA|nr:hypothetical protein [Bacillus sp. FJAT-27225]OCA85738.1 hypothetical protein A8F94_12755 [Bacillus sp. FJAT-27225]
MNEKEPFNDVIDHYNKIEGNPANAASTDWSKLPKPIRLIGYFLFGLLGLGALLILVLSIFR